MKQAEEQQRKRAEDPNYDKDQERMEQSMKRMGKILAIVVGVYVLLRILNTYGFEAFSSVTWTEFQQQLLPSGKVGLEI